MSPLNSQLKNSSLWSATIYNLRASLTYLKSSGDGRLGTAGLVIRGEKAERRKLFLNVLRPSPGTGER